MNQQTKNKLNESLSTSLFPPPRFLHRRFRFLFLFLSVCFISCSVLLFVYLVCCNKQSNEEATFNQTLTNQSNAEHISTSAHPINQPLALTLSLSFIHFVHSFVFCVRSFINWRSLSLRSTTFFLTPSLPPHVPPNPRAHIHSKQTKPIDCRFHSFLWCGVVLLLCGGLCVFVLHPLPFMYRLFRPAPLSCCYVVFSFSLFFLLAI